MRVVRQTDQFAEYVEKQNESFKKKLAYILIIIKEHTIIPTKFVKHLVNTEFYEARIQIGNEYRIIIFSVDAENIMEATEIIFLNCFIKKSKKDYKKAIEQAEGILDEYTNVDE